MEAVPWVHVVGEREALPVDVLLPVTGTTYVARLDGRQMLDPDSVFQQFYDRLRLPDYFGWNWDALSDCLRDLRWLPADRYVVIVEAAHQVLSGDTSARPLLFRTLRQAALHWSCTQQPEGVRLSKLVIILTCDDASVPALREQV